MSITDDFVPYGVVVIGLGTLVIAGWVPAAMPEPARWALLAVGGALTVGGGFWIDHRRAPIESATAFGARALALLGLGLLFVGTGTLGVTEPLRLGAAAVGLTCLLVVGYWGYARRLPRESDERQRRIRYRAVYNAFLVVNGLLFAGMVLAFTSSPPTEEAVGAGATLVGLAAFAVFAAGLLVALVSEGWYRTRM